MEDLQWTEQLQSPAVEHKLTLAPTTLYPLNICQSLPAQKHFDGVGSEQATLDSGSERPFFSVIVLSFWLRNQALVFIWTLVLFFEYQEVGTISMSDLW